MPCLFPKKRKGDRRCQQGIGHASTYTSDQWHLVDDDVMKSYITSLREQLVGESYHQKKQ